MMNRLAYPLFALLATLVALPAHADLMISFTEDGTPGVFHVEVGKTVDVPVYIFQMGEEVVLTDEGLKTAAVQVRFNETGTNSSILSQSDLLLPNYWDPGLSFTLLGSDVQGNYAELAGAISIGGTPVKGVAILIGTMTFTGRSFGDVTEIRSGHTEFIFPSNEPTIISGGNRQLDNLVFANTTTAQIITAVPEPSTFLLSAVSCAIIAFGFVVRHRQRR